MRNAFPVESCLFHLILYVPSIPSLPKFNFSCSAVWFVCCDLFVPFLLFIPTFLCLFPLTDQNQVVLSMPWPILTSCDFMILWDVYLRWEHVHLESPLLSFEDPGFRKWNQFWHLGWSAMGLHQTPGLAQCFQCQPDSSASELVYFRRWEGDKTNNRNLGHTDLMKRKCWMK